MMRSPSTVTPSNSVFETPTATVVPPGMSSVPPLNVTPARFMFWSGVNVLAALSNVPPTKFSATFVRVTPLKSATSNAPPMFRTQSEQSIVSVLVHGPFRLHVPPEQSIVPLLVVATLPFVLPNVTYPGPGWEMVPLFVPAALKIRWPPFDAVMLELLVHAPENCVTRPLFSERTVPLLMQGHWMLRYPPRHVRSAPSVTVVPPFHRLM